MRIKNSLLNIHFMILEFDAIAYIDKVLKIFVTMYALFSFRCVVLFVELILHLHLLLTYTSMPSLNVHSKVNCITNKFLFVFGPQLAQLYGPSFIWIFFASSTGWSIGVYDLWKTENGTGKKLKHMIK